MSKKWNKSSRGKTVFSTFPWWISSMLFSKNIPSLCYLVTISWWFRANSVGSCFDSSTWRKNRNPEKGTNFSQHLMENLWVHKSLLSIFKKKQTFNKHITRNHNIISTKTHLNHLKIKSIEPTHYSPATVFSKCLRTGTCRPCSIRLRKSIHLGVNQFGSPSFGDETTCSHVSIPSQSLT